jgi:hypothetical protein
MFLAIEVTFGLLGMAIFASAASARGTHPGTGIGIWTIVLSIIALYFGGKTASRISGIADHNLGVYHGIVTFGMSIFATVLILSLMMGSSPSATNPDQFSPATLNHAIATGGWWLFFALLLGFIAAATGGSHGVVRYDRATKAPTSIDREVRRAA